ncbi:MAG: hypothetical protein GY888_31000, partial [Planctomycetaceae bacterium]|nr:hypothetical protein [Planctomycetaceae bacterium]
MTEPAVEGQDVTVVATTPAGALTYKFELEFSTGNWLTVQDSSSNTWAPAIGTDGFFWRVIVTADDGTDTDSETFNSSGRITAPSTGVLQAMTWVLTTGATSGTVASTGLEIINSLKTSQLAIGIGPRFWNGSEAENYGADPISGDKYAFDNGTEGKAWWIDNYQARIRQNGRDWMVMDGNTPGEIYWSGPMTQYNNIGGGAQPSLWGDWWIDQAQGQTLDIEMHAKGQLPDNWNTYQQGAGTSVGLDVNDKVLDFASGYPGITPSKLRLKSGASYGGLYWNYWLESQYVGNNQNAVDAMPDYMAVYVLDPAATTAFNRCATAG